MTFERGVPVRPLMLPAAIALAGAAIGAAILAASGIAYYGRSRYQLATTISNGNAIAWRLNTQTGVVTVCALAKNPDPFAAIGPEVPINRVIAQCSNERFAAATSAP